MFARTGRDARPPGAAAQSHRHSPQLSREQLWRENERLRQEVEDLRRKIADSEKKVTDAEKQVAERDQQIAEREKQIADAEKKITELEQQLALRKRNSTNSSKPPSSDGLAGPERPRGGQREKSGRKPGGQKGHPGHWRPLVPEERVNQVVEVFPDHCEHCQRELPEDPAKRVTVGEPQRHQVTELPQIEAHIIEYRLHTEVCPDCGKQTSAAAAGRGERLSGCAVDRADRLYDLCVSGPATGGAELSGGGAENSPQPGQCAKGLGGDQRGGGGTLRRAGKALPQQQVLNADETSSYTNGDKRWLWAFVAKAFVFYTIEKTRGTQVLVRLLGEAFAGVLCCDRFSSYLKYRKYRNGLMQFCWAHFKRNLWGALEAARTRRAKRFCKEALTLEQRLFHLWYRFRGGVSVRGSPLTRPQLITKSIPLQKKLFALGESYRDCHDKDARNLAQALFEHSEKFFTFVQHEGVEPTNNSAERAERTAVIWRKISFGNRSAEGEVAVARLLTVTRTCQLQKRNTLAYLSQAIKCYRTQQPVASLLA